MTNRAPAAAVAASSAATEKLARQRLSVLELAQTLGSVSTACRQRGVSRTQFYEYTKRFQEQGLAGLKDLPPIHKTHPQTTAPEIVARVRALSLERPGWGCYKLSDYLKFQGISVSGPTIQNILAKQGLGSKYERLLRLEERALEEGMELTPEQVALVEKANPCYRERHVESSRPGDLLCQDTYLVGNFKGGARSTCTAWWIRMAPTPLAFSTRAACLRRRWRCCTTMCSPSTPRTASRWTRS